MAVAYKGIRQAYTDGGTSITIQIPAVAAAGDLLIAYISKDDNVAIYETEGWNDFTQIYNNIANGQSCLYIAWRIATSGDVSGAVSWTWNADSEDWIGEILCYSGTKTDTPIHGTPGISTGTSATPTAPSVAFTNLTAGSMVLQVMGIDQDDNDYVVPSQLTSRFNTIQANDIGGAGGDRECTSTWVSPTSFDDPDTQWIGETNIYDEDTATYGEDSVDANSWGSYVELNIDAISCSHVRFFARYLSQATDQISVDVYYASAWHNIYEGIFANAEWVEKAIGSTETVTAMRMKFHGGPGGGSAVLYEADFLKLEALEGSGNTGTAVFTATSRPWAAATLVIEALAGGATQALISTATIATSITSALSRGVTEALTSTATIASSITSSLTRGITQALTSTSNLISSITGSLSRGTTEALISTSNIATSITGRITKIIDLISTSTIATSITSSLSRGIKGVLTSTSNIATSITGSLSRGVTEALTSTSNIVTSITATLTKVAGETHQLISTAVIAITTTSSLSRGITEALISVSNIATSITGSLSRGITESLTSTANIVSSFTSRITRIIDLASTSAVVTSITGVLGRGITQALVSTSNISTSITSSLSRGVTEALTSTANIAVSISGILSKIGSIALTSISNIVCVLGEEVDIGSPAIYTGNGYGYGNTFIEKANPANASGVITTIEIYAYNDMSNVEVATFYSTGANQFSTRDTHAIGSVTAGGKRTFSGLNIAVEEGDYIGIYYTYGSIARGTTDGQGYWYLSGDNIPCTETNFGLSGNTTYWHSLYGKGGGVTLGRGITEVLTSTSAIVTSITSTLSRGIKEVLASTSTIATSITSSLSRGITATLVSTSNIITSITGNLSRGVTEALTSTSAIATSITGVLSRGVTKALTSTVNIVSSITAVLKAIYHWAKVTKETAECTKVEKEKGDWIRVEKEKSDGSKVSKEKDNWTLVSKEKGDCTKVEKD